MLINKSINSGIAVRLINRLHIIPVKEVRKSILTKCHKATLIIKTLLQKPKCPGHLATILIPRYLPQTLSKLSKRDLHKFQVPSI